METLPVEIVQHIFALACTDGGHTGCALSLVSREIRALSRAVRFRSIYLVAYPSRVEAFTSLYVRLCEEGTGAKPKIEHLYFTFPIHRNGTPTLLPVASGASQTLAPHYSAVDAPPITETPVYIFRQAAIKLMRLVAPQLKTLVLQRGLKARPTVNVKGMFSIFDVPFPRVRELTAVRFANLDALLVPSARCTPLFPVATHLRLVHAGFRTRREGTLETWLHVWRTHAPRATHLYATCFEGPNAQFASALADGLGIATREGLRPPNPPAYPTLRSVIFEPNANLVEPWPDDAESYFQLVKFRAHFEKACSERGVKAVVLDPCALSFEECAAKLRDEWEDRAGGGVGGWGDLCVEGEKRQPSRDGPAVGC